MNWTAGIIAFCLFYIPMAIIFYRFHQDKKRIEEHYDWRNK